MGVYYPDCPFLDIHSKRDCFLKKLDIEETGGCFNPKIPNKRPIGLTECLCAFNDLIKQTYKNE